jgi:ubiquinone biosynthesis protein UbiJ
MLIESPLAAALNHLLDAEPWARERLSPFEGKTLELRAPLAPALRFVVEAGGRLAPAAAGQPASVTLTLTPEALPAAAKGEDHLVRAIEVEGDDRLASEVLFLVRNLRWDPEEDLSALVGDVAAHRLAQAARALAALHADAARRLAEGFMEYAIEERRILVARRELEGVAAATARLRDDLDRLEKRIARLEGG